MIPFLLIAAKLLLPVSLAQEPAKSVSRPASGINDYLSQRKAEKNPAQPPSALGLSPSSLLFTALLDQVTALSPEEFNRTLTYFEEIYQLDPSIRPFLDFNPEPYQGSFFDQIYLKLQEESWSKEGLQQLVPLTHSVAFLTLQLIKKIALNRSDDPKIERARALFFETLLKRESVEKEAQGAQKEFSSCERALKKASEIELAQSAFEEAALQLESAKTQLKRLRRKEARQKKNWNQIGTRNSPTLAQLTLPKQLIWSLAAASLAQEAVLQKLNARIDPIQHHHKTQAKLISVMGGRFALLRKQCESLDLEKTSLSRDQLIREYEKMASEQKELATQVESLKDAVKPLPESSRLVPMTEDALAVDRCLDEKRVILPTAKPLSPA